MFDTEALAGMTDTEKSKYYAKMQKLLTVEKKALSGIMSETVDERKEQRGYAAQLKRDNKAIRATLRIAIAFTQTAFSKGDDDQITDLAKTVLTASKTFSDHLVAYVRNRHGQSEMAKTMIDEAAIDDEEFSSVDEVEQDEAAAL